MNDAGRFFVRAQAAAFGTFCDEHGLSQEQGRDLAERLADVVTEVADDRFVPREAA